MSDTPKPTLQQVRQRFGGIPKRALFALWRASTPECNETFPMPHLASGASITWNADEFDGWLAVRRGALPANGGATC